MASGEPLEQRHDVVGRALAPAGVRVQKEIILGQGRIYAIDEFDNKKRQKIDLPPLPTSCDMVKVLFES